jgi:hypothetical protein
MMNIKTHKWYKDLDTSLSECDYYFPDDKYGIRYCIQLQIEPGDTYWSADLYKCDEDWNITEYWQRINVIWGVGRRAESFPPFQMIVITTSNHI